MRYILIITLLVSAACGGSLSDEQRKTMREQMELHEIRRVTDTEITEAAFARGREITTLLERFSGDSVKIDSLLDSSKANIRWLAPGAANASLIEQQLIDAYIASDSGAKPDNVQKIRHADGDSDSILYTKPVLSKMPDGRDKLEGVWNIWLSRKQLILSMDKKD